MAVSKRRKAKPRRITRRGEKDLGVHRGMEKNPSQVTFRIITERLRSKPRLVRSDVWKKRPIVENWYAWKDLVAMTYREQCGYTFTEPVFVYYYFQLCTHRKIDVDNLIKGVNDALNGLAWPDDRIKYVKGCWAVTKVDDKNQAEELRVTIRKHRLVFSGDFLSQLKNVLTPHKELLDMGGKNVKEKEKLR